MDKKHSVYVIELDPVVLESKKFREANPGYAGSYCLYVGMTGLPVNERFANHRMGKKANRYVQHFGLNLVPELYEHLNPMTYEDAVAMEQKLAAQLRANGFAVWQA